MPEIQLSPAPDPLDALLQELQEQHPDDESLTPEKSSKPAGEIVLVTGEVLDMADVEAIRFGLEWVARMKDRYSVILGIEAQLREAAGALAGSGNRTQRLIGESGSVLHVTMPTEGWDDAKIRNIWDAFPQWRDKCLKISKVSVAAREWAKLLTVSDAPESLVQFIEAVKAARKPASGLPTVKIEQPTKAIDVLPLPEPPDTSDIE